MTETAFAATRFTELPGWAEADLSPALRAFARSAERLGSGAVRTGALGVSADAFLSAAAAVPSVQPRDARSFFEDHFLPATIRAEGGTGFVTGYFEPVLQSSRTRTARFAVPLHARPPDLVPVDPSSLPTGLAQGTAFARRLPDGTLVEHPDRAQIAAGALDGQGLEIAFLESPIDAFFVHVQGSARLELTDGTSIRVGYAGKSGHAYTSIGRVLVDAGALALGEADMAGLRAWLAAHPSRQRDILDRNRSYIFFAERSIADDALGPVGAAGVPLEAMASLALDHRLHTFGLPVFLDAPTLTVEQEPFRRLLIAQDTGSAIVGPARGDIFVGSGEEAGRLAGTIRHPAQFHALVPKPLRRRLAR